MLQPNPYMQKLLMKFVKNKCSAEEIDLIIDYLKKTDGTNEFPDFDEVLQLFDVIPDIEEQRAQEIYNNILKSVEPRKPKKTYKRFVRYAVAAAFVGVLVTSYFFVQNKLNPSEDDNLKPVIVNTRNIEPGTDKAVLVLDDGSQVILEKGKTIQAQNANSNGRKLVYEANHEKSDEVVYHDLFIPRGGQYFVELSDGTKVWLNSETHLKYPASFVKGKPREVQLLYGEAYFEVSPSTKHYGSKFKVINQSQEIEVLGTQFNVKAYKDESHIYTTLVEGKVAIDNYNFKQNLVPNHQSVLNKLTKEFKVAEVDVNSETSWKNGVFIFRNKPLKQIMKVIERWYDVEIVFVNKDLESTKFRGVIKKHVSIEEVLTIMKSSSINSYDIDGRTIILR